MARKQGLAIAIKVGAGFRSDAEQHFWLLAMRCWHGTEPFCVCAHCNDWLVAVALCNSVPAFYVEPPKDTQLCLTLDEQGRPVFL